MNRSLTYKENWLVFLHTSLKHLTLSETFNIRLGSDLLLDQVHQILAGLLCLQVHLLHQTGAVLPLIF